MPKKRITNLSPEELEDLLLLAPRIFCDHKNTSWPLKMLYIYSQTSDNADSCFRRAIELAVEEKMESIGIAEGELGHGYDGYDESVARLRELGKKYYGWRDGRVSIVKIDVGGNVNTGSEAQALIQWERENIGNIGVVAPPHHITRAFITTVTAIAGRPIWAYAFPGVPVPWGQQVRHSQGTVHGTRAELLGGELQRLEKYRAEEYGNMLPVAEIISYLDWRDELPNNYGKR